jgi:hypothetical protein
MKYANDLSNSFNAFFILVYTPDQGELVSIPGLEIYDAFIKNDFHVIIEEQLYMV